MNKILFIGVKSNYDKFEITLVEDYDIHSREGSILRYGRTRFGVPYVHSQINQSELGTVSISRESVGVYQAYISTIFNEPDRDSKINFCMYKILKKIRKHLLEDSEELLKAGRGLESFIEDFGKSSGEL